VEVTRGVKKKIAGGHDRGRCLERAQLDFVDICTRPYSHAPFARLAAEQGLPVLCQKPFCESLEEVQALVEVCDKAGVRLMINENFPLAGVVWPG
jgi:predicted dehydrogenase